MKNMWVWKEFDKKKKKQDEKDEFNKEKMKKTKIHAADFNVRMKWYGGKWKPNGIVHVFPLYIFIWCKTRNTKYERARSLV